MGSVVMEGRVMGLYGGEKEHLWVAVVEERMVMGERKVVMERISFHSNSILL